MIVLYGFAAFVFVVAVAAIAKMAFDDFTGSPLA
jgi:hypothetical protein